MNNVAKILALSYNQNEWKRVKSEKMAYPTIKKKVPQTKRRIRRGRL
jgi:hypothetical protein